VTGNPHFETATSWKMARNMLIFRPLEPAYMAKLRLQSIRIHVRDHKMRQLSIRDRTMEAHYGGFVLSQARKGIDEARRLVLEVRYGRDGHDATVAGRTARFYELGPEPPEDDIDGPSPAVVVWHDGELHFLIASYSMRVGDLMKIATSLYGSRRPRPARQMLPHTQRLMAIRDWPRLSKADLMGCDYD
jgi:hypothetical protein